MTDHTQDPDVHLPQRYDGDACMRHLEEAGLGRNGCLFNIGKYLWRLGKKDDDVKDASKALWYAKRLAEHKAYGIVLSPEEIGAIQDCASRGLEGASAEVQPIVQEILKVLEDLASMTDQDWAETARSQLEAGDMEGWRHALGERAKQTMDEETTQYLMALITAVQASDEAQEERIEEAGQAMIADAKKVAHVLGVAQPKTLTEVLVVIQGVMGMLLGEEDEPEEDPAEGAD